MKRFLAVLMLILASVGFLWAAEAELLTIPRDVGTIEEEAFFGSKALDEVILPDGIVTIGPRAFSQTSLQSIYLPDTLEAIAEDAFDGSSAVTAYGPPDTYAQQYCEDHHIPYRAYEVTPLEAFTFSYPNAAEAVITGYSGTGNIVVIPAKADEYHKIKTIQKNVFANHPEITAVYFPDTIQTIGSGCFSGCTSLKSVRLPEKLQTLEANTFFGCTSLTTILFNEDLTTIGDGAFASCTALEAVTLPPNLETLGAADSGKGVFNGDTALKTVHYTPSLKTTVSYWYGKGTFSGCTSLKRIEFPEGTETIAPFFLKDAVYLEEVILPSTLISIGEGAFWGDTSLPGISFPESLETIGNKAFNTCTALTEITLSPNITLIDSYAFGGCEKLKTVHYNSVLKTIGDGAFKNCTALVDALLPDSVETIGFSESNDGAFRNCPALKDFRYPLSLKNVPDYWYGKGMLSDCPSLREVVIQEGVTDLADYVFKDAAFLSRVTLPSTLKTVGKYSFAGDVNLPDVKLPETLTLLKEGAFQNCTGLTVFTLPENLEEIHGFAFQGCENLEEVRFNRKLTKIWDGAFEGCVELLRADLPDGIVQLGSNTSDETGGTGVFANCEKLNFFHYPLSLTTVPDYWYGKGMLSGCRKLRSVTVQEGVTDLAANVFKDAPALAEVNLPSTLKTIGKNAFYNTDSLPDIVFPDGLTIIYYRAFYGCDGLTSVKLPAGLKELDACVFENCTNLAEIQFNQNLEKIWNGAFSGCTELLRADLPDGIVQLGGDTSGSSSGTGVFANCEKLNFFHYPLSLTTVPDYWYGKGMFTGCAGLKEVAVPEGVVTLAANVFKDAPALADVTLPSTLTAIGNNAFYGCAEMEWLYVPASVTQLGTNVFKNCGKLTVESEYGSAAIAYCEKNSVPYYYLSKVGSNIPFAKLYKGEGILFTGTIRSNWRLTSVDAVLSSGDQGTVLKQVSLTDLDTVYGLHELSGQFGFDSLALGTYHFRLSAATEKTEEVYMDATFRVVPPPLRMSLSGFVLPSGYLDKNSYVFSGQVNSNYAITSLTLEIKREDRNEDGEAAVSTVFARTVSPGSPSYALSGFGMNFASLEDGSYTFSLKAKAKNGEGVEETRQLAYSAFVWGDYTLPSGAAVDVNAMVEFAKNQGKYVLHVIYPQEFIVRQPNNMQRKLEKALYAFSNLDETLSNTFIDMYNYYTGNDTSGGYRSEKLVNQYKEQILSYIQTATETDDFYRIKDKTAAEKILGSISGGGKLSLSVAKEAAEAAGGKAGSFINQMSALLDGYDVLKNGADYIEDYQKFVNRLLITYCNGDYVLEILATDAGLNLTEENINFSIAVDELRDEFQNHEVAELKNLLKNKLAGIAADKAGDALKDMLKALSPSAAFAFNVAKFAIGLLDTYGDIFDDLTDAEEYVILCETYGQAEARYAVLRDQVLAGDTNLNTLFQYSEAFKMTKAMLRRAMDKLYVVDHELYVNKSLGEVEIKLRRSVPPAFQ